jgi:hypothetical protein
VLQCPRGCAYGSNLHHGKVEVFYRTEDDERVLVTAIDRRIVKADLVPNAGSGNPSSRRNGIRVHFWCELCGDGLIFNLAQHKGQTLLSWTIEPPSGGAP